MVKILLEIELERQRGQHILKGELVDRLRDRIGYELHDVEGSDYVIVAVREMVGHVGTRPPEWPREWV